MSAALSLKPGLKTTPPPPSKPFGDSSKNTSLSRSTSATGLVLTALKASLLLVCIFLTLTPGITTHVGSEVEACIHTYTPGRRDSLANFTAQSRLVYASLLGLSLLLWEPTSTMGRSAPLNAKLRAAAV